MRQLLALVLTACLWLGFAPTASANVGALTPCKDTPAFIARAEQATTEQAKARFEFYGEQLLCGEEGLPHLVVDGRWERAGDFMIPGVMFLYIAGLIGWAGRSYLQAISGDKSPEMKEIVIDLPLAVKCSLSALAWPVLAFKEASSGKMFAKDDEITVSPR
ncbi:MAG: Photosystem I reaction center subunit III [Geitlerinemataceae cyanobacterium]